jgi:hypothetical protein
LQNELCTLPEDLIEEYVEEIIEMLFLEAELIILNKDVIGYLNTQQIGIYSFKEALKMEEEQLKKEILFTYHPINVKSHREQGQLF